MEKRKRHGIWLISAIALLCLSLFSGCSFTGESENSIYARLRKGEVIEAFDTQAVPALEMGLAKHWYPQSTATAVIAVDRERTDAEINGWRDLENAGEAVGFDDTAVNGEMLMAAMSYGLEGENFTLREAAGLLAGLRTKGLFAFGSFDAPIVICLDYQAAAAGMEIIVPGEGTLTYVTGLLSNHPLESERTAQLTDTYANASFVTDYGHLNTVCRDVTRVMRRSVLRIRLYSAADAGEHLLFALLFIILVTVWMATVIQRAMQKNVRRATLLLGILLLGWMLIRTLKYQLPPGTTDRYFWYGFYLFEMALPLTFLWLAWVIDMPDGSVKPPKWFIFTAAAAGILVALVLTNDLHNWVFRLDLSNPNHASEYGYGPVQGGVVAYCALLTLAAMVMMMLRVRQNPHRGGILVPVGFFVLLMVYLVAYAMRVPLAWESDITMTAGIFILLVIESSVSTGLIPVNSKYRQLFTNSSLVMQIIDHAGNVALSSSPSSLRRDSDTLLLTTPITGGHMLWQEDISALNRLRGEAEEAVRRLTAANAILAKDEKVKQAIAEEDAKNQLMEELEAEITGAMGKLSDMIDNRGSAAGIVLLLCYIKRRCNLFFRARETHALPADELTMYIDELAEFAGHADVRVVSASQIKMPVDMRRATLLYDFFYSVADWAVAGGGNCILAFLGSAQRIITMRLQFSEDTRPFHAEEHLAEAIGEAGGTIEVKKLDGAVGVNLSFPEGGETDG